MKNIRPKITIDYEQSFDRDVRLTVAPDDINPEWTVVHEKILGENYSNRHILSIPNESLNDLIQALTIYRNNLKELNHT